MTTGINWTPTGAQAQSLIVYLESLGVGATKALNIRTMVKRITDAYTSVNTHLLVYGNISSYESAGNQGYVPDFNLAVAFSGLTRYIAEICAETWSDVGGGAQTTAATVLTYMRTYRPDISSYLAALLDDIVATDINTNLLSSYYTAPTTVVIGNGADSSLNIYKGAVGTLLREIAHYLRAYCGPTLESNSNSSSNGSYIEGLDVVNPIPTPVT